MADQQSTSQNDSASITITVPDETNANLQQDIATVRLKLRKPKSRKKVNWTEETIDNENMNKKKSKCCCIYQKTQCQESSSSDEDECEHCYGHVEKRKKIPKDNQSTQSGTESPTPSMIVA